jgi:hypothetical protein
MATKGYTEVRYGESGITILRELRAQILLGSFSGDQSDVYCAVHWLRDNRFFFIEYSEEFFRKTFRLLRRGKIREVRRLLVYHEDSELETEETERIIRFHAHAEGFSYRLLKADIYNALRQRHSIHPSIDFGIFGEKRVFRARTDHKDWVIGTWSKRRREVARYRSFFDECWNSSGAHLDVNLEQKGAIVLDELFAPLAGGGDANKS